LPHLGLQDHMDLARSDQLDACVADKPAPKAPSRMCQRCFDLWSSLKDVDRPCRRAGCKGTWSDKRGAQLARLVRGKSADPYPRYCGECEKELGDLEDREIPCRTDGCPGTFTWSKEQQLAAGVRPKFKEPPPVEAAVDAVAVAPTGSGDALPAPDAAVTVVPVAAAAASETAPAPESTHAPAPRHPLLLPRIDRARARRTGVGASRSRPNGVARPALSFCLAERHRKFPACSVARRSTGRPKSQLQTHLGNWAAPGLCGACKLAQVTAAREAAREALRHPQLPPRPESEAPPPATPEGSGSGGRASCGRKQRP